MVVGPKKYGHNTAETRYKMLVLYGEIAKE